MATDSIGTLTSVMNEHRSLGMFHNTNNLMFMVLMSYISGLSVGCERSPSETNTTEGIYRCLTLSRTTSHTPPTSEVVLEISEEHVVFNETKRLLCGVAQEKANRLISV